MRLRLCAMGVLVLVPTAGMAHDWHHHDDTVRVRVFEQPDLQAPGDPLPPNPWFQTAVRLNGGVVKPEIAKHFEHFENVKVRWDTSTLFVESNGLPDHGMMVGIRNWQQQVPLPQPFTGTNSWKIPLQTRLARQPINAKETPFRGAIAVAVNGVPIFSALNNRGEDAYLAGELDKWGGHCGRGDDYHYHIAPLHLEKIVGKGNPIAFALDGYPIYGLTEADGSPVGKLDELNGQFDADGKYHYHATKTYPYINGGVRGAVDYRNGEIASQPRDSPVRPGQPPLRGAVITDFKTTGGQSVLTYQLRGQTGTISYSPAGGDAFRFTYREPGGRTWNETYQRRSAGGPPRNGGPGGGPGPRRGGNRPPRRP